MSAGAKAQQYANTARDKLSGVLSSIRSMTFDEDNNNNNSTTLPTPWENVVRTIFGSCTTGMPEDIISPSNSSRSRSCEPNEPSSPLREKEEFFYSQFLHKNEHSRAEHAVTTLREQPPPELHSPVKSHVPKPFPVSTPPRKQAVVPHTLVQEFHRHSEITSNMSFDDGISCISAHTLEEMARHVDQHRIDITTSDLTSEGFDALESTQSSSIFTPSFSPERLGRNTSKKSHGTKSTRSTKSSGSFEHAWRRDEQQYWQDVVEQEDGAPAERRREIMLQRVEALKTRSRSRDSDSSPDHQSKYMTTPATSGSSFSGNSPFSRHPHETFPYEAHDILNSTVEEEEEIITTKVLYGGRHGDPDRLQEILVLEHETELGEI